MYISVITKLRNSEQSNKGKKKNQPDIGIDKLFHFFKDLNSDSAGNLYEGQLDMDEGTLEQINSHIK